MLQVAHRFVSPALSGTPDTVGTRRVDAQSIAQLMRQHLDLAAPRTDAEALRLLRQAFPSASLAARVTAMAERAR